MASYLCRVFRLQSELENVPFLQRRFLVICNGFIVLPCLDNFDRYADRTGTAKFSLDDVSEKKKQQQQQQQQKQKCYFKLTLFLHPYCFLSFILWSAPVDVRLKMVRGT